MAKRILVPLDANEEAEAVLPLVADLARGAGGTVRLLRVMAGARTRIDADGRVLEYAHDVEARRQAEALDRLRDLEPVLDGVPVEYRARLGEPVTEILHEAEVFGADVIALAVRRRAWWRGALGRVAAGVRAGAMVPVLLADGGGAR
ncbi:MAG TPA: universal stress protein [Methylomirabilota bacterium]|nr:universal stress protein [Methylomirabilota bacterium]